MIGLTMLSRRSFAKVVINYPILMFCHWANFYTFVDHMLCSMAYKPVHPWLTGCHLHDYVLQHANITWFNQPDLIIPFDNP